MTAPEFLFTLDTLDAPWRISHHDGSKRDGSDDLDIIVTETGDPEIPYASPLTYVCWKATGILFNRFDFLKASNRLQLQDYFYINHASIRNEGEYRPQLLMACKLMPKPEAVDEQSPDTSA